MGMTRRLAYIGTCLLLLAATTECSKGASKSSLAKFSVLPSQPIVILGQTAGANGTTITGPWFNFRLSMNNLTGDTVTIVTLQIVTYEEDSSGNQIQNSSSANPSDFNTTLNTANSTTGITCNFASFGTWTPNQNTPLMLTGAADGCSAEPSFYIGSNLTGVSGTNYNYRVEITPLGWFGTFDNPTSRLQTFFDFYTQ